MNFSLLPSSPANSIPGLTQLKRGRPQKGFTFDPQSAPPLPKINIPDVVLQVYTHPSLRRKSPDLNPEDYNDNERFSNLGRIVLESVVTEILFNARPFLRASEIADKRNALLSDELFDDWVTHYKLLAKLRCDLSLRSSFSINKPEEIRAIFHAYVGGLYVDSGAAIVRDWIERLLGQNLNGGGPSVDSAMVPEPSLPQRPQTPPQKKVKGEAMTPGPPVFFGAQPQASPLRNPPPHMRLPPPMSMHHPNPLAPAQPNLPFLPLFNQTATQRRVTVEYPAQFSGPSHAGRWVVRCIVNGIPKGEGTGSSKQTAKEEAARQAYYAMGWT